MSEAKDETGGLARRETDAPVKPADGTQATQAPAAVRVAYPPQPEMLRQQVAAFSSVLGDLQRIMIQAPPPIPEEQRFFDELGANFDQLAKDKEGEDILGRLVVLSEKMQGYSDPGVFRQGILALRALRAGKVTAAKTILSSLEYSTSRNSPVYAVVFGLLIFLTIGLGIGASMYGALLSFPELVGIFVMQHASFIVSALAGVLGAIASMILRINEFEEAHRRRRWYMAALGFCLPLIGMIFAMVISALFLSGLINVLPLDKLNQVYLFFVLGFLSGFSERFARNLLGQAENIFAGHAETATRSPPGTAAPVKPGG